MSTIRNPILPGFHPDPSIVQVDGDFYLATSTFEWFPGVALFHSRDLAHWRPIGHALPNRTATTSTAQLFRPTGRHRVCHSNRLGRA